MAAERRRKQMKKIRVLFLPLVDAANTNAQSLNTREVALRLDPERFESTLFYEGEPDLRLTGLNGIRLVKLPQKGKTRKIVGEMMSEPDVIAYMDYSPASYFFVHLPQMLRRGSKTVIHAEAPNAQLVNPSRTLTRLYRGVVRRCDVYTAITDFVAKDMEQSLGRKARYILPVGVDTKLFTPPARRNNAAPTVLFAGTLIERKGPQYVIEAAARYPEARFRIVGNGRQGYEQVLRKKMSEMGVSNVTLDGAKSQAEMLAMMQASDIFMLPSRLEGIPKVTLEAAATGLPCVVFRDYQTPSVVDGVTGFRVGTLEEMFDAIGKLISSGSSREQMGRAAREHMARFDWDLVAKQWEDAYAEIAGHAVR